MPRTRKSHDYSDFKDSLPTHHLWWTELRDRIVQLSIQVDSQDKGRSEQGEIALAAFELSQTLKEKWLTADYRAKRTMLEIVC